MNTSMSSDQLLDVSFAGSTINIAGRTITQFMDDANPIDVQNLEVTRVGYNCNGKMIRTAQPGGVMISVTVIPSSSDDAFFHNLLMNYHLQDGKNNSTRWETALTASITINGNRDKKTWAFTGGTMVSGPGGPSSSADGKLAGRTYTFAFAKVTA